MRFGGCSVVVVVFFVVERILVPVFEWREYTKLCEEKPTPTIAIGSIAIVAGDHPGCCWRKKWFVLFVAVPRCGLLHCFLIDCLYCFYCCSFQRSCEHYCWHFGSSMVEAWLPLLLLLLFVVAPFLDCDKVLVVCKMFRVWYGWVVCLKRLCCCDAIVSITSTLRVSFSNEQDGTRAVSWVCSDCAYYYFEVRKELYCGTRAISVALQGKEIHGRRNYTKKQRQFLEQTPLWAICFWYSTLHDYRVYMEKQRTLIGWIPN